MVAARLLIGGMLLFLVDSHLLSAVAAGQQPADFESAVLPILRRHCFRCHGPRAQEAELHLGRRDEVLDPERDLVKPADPEASLLWQRLTDPEQGELMPLDSESLSAEELESIRSWIAGGAVWPAAVAEANHWAYQPVARPPLPPGADPQRPIDAFIDRRLQELGWEANGRADRSRLIRRVTLGLTGLPPSPDEVRDFVEDPSPTAYAKVVDRLLASPRYGERWAVPWLDLARYADSNGFQADQIRDNWAYRDWVIRAFNRDQPFNEFVMDQIAGDLRPNATLAQKIATGFHRMTTCNVEAGVHPEANRVNQVFDRVNTTSTVFLGTTMECAQCHDHKYDPFSQRDYYQLFAYFNNTPLEVRQTAGVTWDFYGPTMELPLSAAKQRQREQLLQQKQQLVEQRASTAAASDEAYRDWLQRVAQLTNRDSVWAPQVPLEFDSSADESFEILPDGAVLLTGSVPDTVDHRLTYQAPQQTLTAIRVDVLTDPRIPGNGPGRGDSERTNIILSELTVELIRGEQRTPLSFDKTMADFSQKGWPVANAIDGNRKTGWAVAPQFGKPHWAGFVLDEPLHLNGDERIEVTLGQYYGRGRVIGKPRVSFSDSASVELLDVPAEIAKLARKPQRNPKQEARVRKQFDSNNPALARIDRQLQQLDQQLAQTKPDTTLVMNELDQKRTTHILKRGEYDQPLDEVTARFPDILPDDSTIEPTGDRWELAQRLTSRRNPLLARVTVNRWWSELFGRGLVTTPEDFGTQAEWPSHPKLLDWLAAELMDSGWSMKTIHRAIVMSEAYQRDATLVGEASSRDPHNRWLARGPRFRLPAELVRDQALAISGLLSEKMYGPPVMPYQPKNVWRSVGRNQPKWVAAQDEDRFRRGLYVIWKRAAPYPSFVNFDAPNRGSCTVSRGRSNTPLQALTLLNDPAYAEMALAFADRVLSEGGNAESERMEYAFRLALSRLPTARERAILGQLLHSERAVLQDDPQRVAALTRWPFVDLPLQTSDRLELAAWFSVTNALLNLDETINP